MGTWDPKDEEEIQMLGVFGFAMSLVPQKTATGMGSAPVTVTNRLPMLSPRPWSGPSAVSGSVNVVNTPNVSAAQSGSWNVGITGTPTVDANVTFPSSLAVRSPLDGQGNPTPLAALDATQPYEDQCSISAGTFGTGGGEPSVCFFKAIPSGKRLVVQEFDTGGLLDPGLQPFIIGWASSFSSGSVEHFFTATLTGSMPLANTFFSHQQTRLYAPASSQPVCVVQLTGAPTSQFTTWNCELSGCLVDVP